MTDSTAVHSNAFNFMSYIAGGVDPRTNQYTFSINFPEFKPNFLNGPLLSLAMGFNPMNRHDSGYGTGWNVQQSQYRVQRQILTLNSGERYKVTAQREEGVLVELLMKEKKLNTFRFYRDKDDDQLYRLVHKSGLVEELRVHGRGDDAVALPVRMIAPEGHAVTLGHLPFGAHDFRLASISDERGDLLKVDRQEGSVILDLHPTAGANGTPLARYSMTLDSGTEKYVNVITLPSEAGRNVAWRLNYRPVGEYTCIVSVETPLGGREEVVYDAQGHEFPTGSGRQPIPRVKEHRVFPGSGQPMVETHYSFTDGSTYLETNNFLGRNLALSWNDDGLDNLYQFTGSHYAYGCTEHLMDGGVEVQRIKRTFNQFHLLTLETTTRNTAQQEVETVYGQIPGGFDGQPDWFQLPHEVTNRWRLGSQLRSEKSSSTYDSYGNLLVQTHPTGVVETSFYYDKDGEDGCPKDPDGFVRNLKSQTQTPAPGYVAGAPTLRTDYRYELYPSLDGSGRSSWLALERETLTRTAPGAVMELRSTAYEYYHDKDDAQAHVVHGRLKHQSVALNEKATKTAYTYGVTMGTLADETVLQTVETLTTDFDQVHKIITLESSLLNGESLLERDDNDVEIRRTYDVLNRVTSETVAPNDPRYKATRNYEYYLSASIGQRAEQWLFDVKGVKTVTAFDGLNRAVYEERNDADSSQPTMRQTYAAQYDVFGNLIEQTEYDWWGAQEKAFKTRFLFDDWNQPFCEIGPDGVERYKQVNPIGDRNWSGPIERSWEQDSTKVHFSGITETRLNLFEKPVQTERLALDESVISRQKYSYDGLGRSVKEELGLRTPLRVTEYSYDAFDRMTQTILPQGARIVREYAEHSAEDWPTRISVDGQELGTQTFDGLGRMTESVTGGRLQRYEYDPQQTRPKTVTPASGQTVEYQYMPQLSDEPLRRQLSGGDICNYEYDPANARLTKASVGGRTLARTYFSFGEPKSETVEADGQTFAMAYEYSFRSRLLSYTDVLDQIQQYEYDPKGRLERTSLGTTSSAFTYDALGRVATITTQDIVDGAPARTLGISLEYDEFHREIKRTFDLDGVIQVLDQVYDEFDCLVRRTLTEGPQTLRDETYAYDLRGRLETYTCAGSQPPIDPYGNRLSGQTFIFDAMDNLIIVITETVDGKNNMAEYHYENPQDPAQLSRVTNSGDAGHPDELVLSYDANGNLIQDEQGRVLEYDALNRLLSVSESGTGKTGNFQYDPLDRLSNNDDGGGSQQHFYKGDHIANLVDGERSSTFMRGDDHLLAERQGDNTLLLAGNFTNSVMNEVSSDSTHSLAYSPYGHRSAEQPISTELGFNGELREAQTGGYMLGKGYRVYSPVLMRFNSPDSWSPFGKGGLNGYAYSQRPLDEVDPTGHFVVNAALGALLLGVIAASTSVGAALTDDNTARIVFIAIASVAGVASIGLGVAAFRMTPAPNRMPVAHPRSRTGTASRPTGNVPRPTNDPFAGATAPPLSASAGDPYAPTAPRLSASSASGRVGDPYAATAPLPSNPPSYSAATAKSGMLPKYTELDFDELLRGATIRMNGIRSTAP
ncbi:RHS repeat-associated core domain-containing protein [Pseudomonas sp. NFACC05-1]|uniref:RHS repeat-associated core domain-containing protein n=1 Tax=Pseudomonas sp. NFACC05-1 TaxID=1566241 RepID=UPI0008711BC6|nr:RHS repeat-associated core domain-containing protein [Pseudomonas sp. NFACC05-1]SCW94838.1 RHS repeat-associated core domain-containing protein [Pseudomonas sp. NFACC05-1]